MTSEPDSDEEQRSPKKKTTKRKIENDESEESEGTVLLFIRIINVAEPHYK